MRKTFDNAAFMGAQHKGNTVSGGWVLPRHPDQRGLGQQAWSRLGILRDSQGGGGYKSCAFVFLSSSLKKWLLHGSVSERSFFEEFSLKKYP